MHRALVVAIFVCLFGTVHAHPKITSSAIKSEAVAQVTLPKNTEIVKVRAMPEASLAPSIKGSTQAVEGGWGKYGTLLATLVVMCAIAVRRQRLGRP